MLEFETEEQVIASSDEVDINWGARTILTPAGIRAEKPYWERLAQYGIKLPVRQNPEQFESQLHFLMNRFGPLFKDGSEEPPFTKVTLNLTDAKSPPTRTIHVNDFMYLGLTPNGEEQLARYFPDQRYIRRVDRLVNLQFHTIAHIFGENAYVGDSRYEIQNNTLYLPRTTAQKSES